MNIPDTPSSASTNLPQPDSGDPGKQPGTHRPRRLLRSPKVWIAGTIALVVLVGIGVGSFFLFSPKPVSYTHLTLPTN
jgi:hypothetical protein